MVERARALLRFANTHELTVVVKCQLYSAAELDIVYYAERYVMGKSLAPAEGIVGSRIRYDETPRDLVVAINEHKFEGRIFNPQIDPAATVHLRDQRELWRAAGHTVVLTSGVFDLFHLNHASLLEYSRMSAMPYHFDRYDAAREGALWEDLTPDQRRDYTIHSLSAGLIKQVVSIDGNAHVAARKNGDPAKGGRRPVYDWETRARDVLMVGGASNGSGPRFLVDAVTIHDGVDPAFAGTPHQGIMDIGQYVGPDVWAIHIESQDIIRAIDDDTEGIYADIIPVVLPHRGPYMDRLTGGLSTSSVVERVMAPNE